MYYSSTNYTISGSSIILPNANIDLKLQIQKHIEVSFMLIVLVTNPSNNVFNDNVFGISIKDAQVKWQIEKLTFTTGDNCPFIDILMIDGNLRLNNWCDTYVIVDPNTGQITQRGLPQKY